MTEHPSEHSHSAPQQPDHASHTKNNEEYFDSLASRYDTEDWQRELSRKAIAFIQANRDIVLPDTAGAGEEAIRLLDYACGPGMITIALAPYIESAVGIDLSANMVQRYNTDLGSDSCKLLNGRKERLRAKGYKGDLLSSSTPPEEFTGDGFYNFACAGIGLGFHHFSSFDTALARLKERLRPGGKVFILDFVDDAVKLASSTVSVHGFSQEAMFTLFERAGLRDSQYVQMDGKVEMRMQGKSPIQKSLFLASAVKA